MRSLFLYDFGVVSGLAHAGSQTVTPEAPFAPGALPDARVVSGALLMADAPPLLIFGLIAAAVVALIVVAAYLERKRRQALAALARAHGFDFDPSPGRIDRAYEGFSPFGRGHSRRCRNLIHGARDDVQWRIFDYRYKTGHGKHQSTHSYGMAVAHVPLRFARMEMRPEGFLDSIAAALGFDDIDFESDAFSRRYHVKSPDRKLAYDLLHPRMIEYLLAMPERHWQFGDGVIILMRSGRFQPDEVPEIINLVAGFLERIPEFVRQDIGLTAGRTATEAAPWP